MRDTGTIEAYRIPSSAFFPSSGRENLIDDCPLGDFCLCVSPQVLFAAYPQAAFFFFLIFVMLWYVSSSASHHQLSMQLTCMSFTHTSAILLKTL